MEIPTPRESVSSVTEPGIQAGLKAEPTPADLPPNPTTYDLCVNHTAIIKWNIQEIQTTIADLKNVAKDKSKKVAISITVAFKKLRDALNAFLVLANGLDEIDELSQKVAEIAASEKDVLLQLITRSDKGFGKITLNVSQIYSIIGNISI